MDKKIIVVSLIILILCAVVVSILSFYGFFQGNGNWFTGSALQTGISRAGECTSGTTRPCGSNVGMCKEGTRTCVNGIWGNCVGGVNPINEMCNGIDDDCNGFTDDGSLCPEGQSCLSGKCSPSEYKISKSLSFATPRVKKTFKDYYSVEVEGLQKFSKPGEPVLPFYTVKILLPQGTDDYEISVYPGVKQTLPGSYLIEPGQKPVPILPDVKIEFTEPDQTIYNSLQPYPPSLYTDLGTQEKMGYSILLINIFPVQYIPKEGRIDYYPNINLEIVVASQKALVSPSFRNIDSDKEEISKIVENPTSKEIDSYTQKSTSGSSSLGLKTSYEYVIITKQEYVSSFQPLINWKTTRSKNPITATIVTVEDILANPNYYCNTSITIAWNDSHCVNDTQARIRNFIRDAYSTWTTKYVLLGGDSDDVIIGGETQQPIVPVRDLYAMSEDHDEGDNVPSDLYYSCLTGTFDYDQDGLFGEPYDGSNGHEVDLYGEVYVGRAPIDSTGEVQNFTRKTIAYENASINDDPYLRKALMLGEYLGQIWSIQIWGKDYKEEIRLGACIDGHCTEGFPPSFNVTTLYDKDYPGCTDLHDPDCWNKTELLPKINNNLGIINHLGHASTLYNIRLCNAPYFQEMPGCSIPYCGNSNLTDVNLFNNTKYFFAYSQGCYSGAFDNWHYRRNNSCEGSYTLSDSIAEHFVNDEYGAFAFVGNSRYGWVSISTDSESNLFDKEFFDAVFGESITNLGRANADSKEDNIGYLGGNILGTNRMEYFELNLFGDPETSLYIPPPPQHNIGIRPNITVGRAAVGYETNVSVTLRNSGLSNESNVVVNLFVNSIFESTKTIPFIRNGTDVTVNLSWTPDVSDESELNVSVVPVPGETFLQDNSKIILVEDVYPASFNDIYSDYGLDTNGNGLYDYLVINVGVNIGETGNYSVRGEILNDYFYNTTFLNTGTQTVKLNIPGLTIRKKHTNGPYQLRNLKLYYWVYDYDSRSQPYNTSYYNYTSFESGPDVEAYSLSHKTILINYSNIITGRIKNIGTEIAENTVASLFYKKYNGSGSCSVNENYILTDTKNIGNISVDEQKEINLSWIPTSDYDYCLKLFVNCTDDFDPENNVKTETVYDSEIYPAVNVTFYVKNLAMEYVNRTIDFNSGEYVFEVNVSKNIVLPNMTTYIKIIYYPGHKAGWSNYYALYSARFRDSKLNETMADVSEYYGDQRYEDSLLLYFVYANDVSWEHGKVYLEFYENKTKLGITNLTNISIYVCQDWDFTNKNCSSGWKYANSSSILTIGDMIYADGAWGYDVEAFALGKEIQACSDGTLYGQCNNQSQYCDDGVLRYDCYRCGCPSGGCCERTTNRCSSTCIDGTLLRQCSANKPKYCGFEDGRYCNLFDACVYCGCPAEYDANGVPKYICKSNKGSIAGSCVINPNYCNSSMVLRLPFDEGNGSIANDSTCYHNNGNITGAGWVTGYSGYALSFDGDDDRVEVNDSKSLNISGEITISALVKFTGNITSNYGTIVKKEHAYILRFDKNPIRLQGIIFTGSTPLILVSNKTSWNIGEWYNIIFIYDKINMKLYVNNVLDSSMPWTTNIQNSDSALSIGNGYYVYGGGWNESFPGVIDELRIYPSVPAFAFPAQAAI